MGIYIFLSVNVLVYLPSSGWVTGHTVNQRSINLSVISDHVIVIVWFEIDERYVAEFIYW